MFKKLSAIVFALVALATTHVTAELAIHEGDRVVFLGDSITEQRLYTTYVEAYTLARHPGWDLTFRNVGWGGDTAWLRQRAHPNEANLFAADEATQQEMVEKSVGYGLKRDVLPLDPTFVTVKFGMNDHSYQAFRPDIFAAYVRSQSQICKVLKGHGVRVAFLTPQPIEEKRPDPQNDVRNQSLRKFADGLEQVAQNCGARFVDQFDPYMRIMLAERAKDPHAFIGGGDAVHPGPIGHTVMAWAILKGLGTSADVSSATVDASRKALTGNGCQLSHLTVDNGTVSFDRLDKALPMPIDERAEQALKLAPILDDLSHYELRVTGLAPGDYEVTIDGETCLKTDAESLAKGVNLSNCPGPITEQTRRLLGLVFQKNNTFFTRWRNVQLYTFPAWARTDDAEARRAAELKRLDEEIAATEAKINEVRQPVSHHFVVKPAA